MNVMITKSNKNNTLIVTVTVDPVGMKGVEEFVDTRAVKNHLDSKNIRYGNCIQSAVVTNTSSKLMGEWIFENPANKKTQKTIDNTGKTILQSNNKPPKKVEKNKEKDV